jgi:hypothetical protein
MVGQPDQTEEQDPDPVENEQDTLRERIVNNTDPSQAQKDPQPQQRMTEQTLTSPPPARHVESELRRERRVIPPQTSFDSVQQALLVP